MNDQILLKIDAIADELKNYLAANKNPNLGLLSGKIGYSLFFAHYALLTKKQDDYQYAYDLIEDVVNNSQFSLEQFTYSSGISGLGWLIEHLKNIGFIDVDSNELLMEFDFHLENRMESEILDFNYDFLHGGSGVLFYFLNKDIKPNILKLAKKGIEDLENTSVKRLNLMAWLDYDVKEKKRKLNTYNLGLAHGIPGILSILCKAYDVLPSFRERIKPLIVSTTSFILNHYDKFEEIKNFCSIFPYSVNDSEHTEKNSRLAWCYGDLGVVISLYHANLILKDPKTDDIILDVLKHSSTRKSLQINSVYDAGLCHGSSGIAHIFHFFFIKLGHDFLKNASDYWFQVSLDQAKFENGIAGYLAFTRNDGYIKSYGFLEGVAGIGLSYITYLNNDFSWNKSLLISI